MASTNHNDRHPDPLDDLDFLDFLLSDIDDQLQGSAQNQHFDPYQQHVHQHDQQKNNIQIRPSPPPQPIAIEAYAQQQIGHGKQFPYQQPS